MRKIISVLTILTIALFFAQISYGQKVDDLVFYNVKELIKEGKATMIGQAEHSDDSYFYRIPKRLNGIVRKEIWDLGQDGAGIAIRFSTDATCIGAKWTLTKNFGMSHMAATGVKGLDLYVLSKKIELGSESESTKVETKEKKRGETTKEKIKDAIKSIGNDIKDLHNKAIKAMEGKEWKYAGTAFPNGKNSASIFIRKMAGGQKEYLLYLPLYDGIEELEIGIEPTAKIFAPNEILNDFSLPAVFYGTSVTQGGCASRPGMAYPSIIERATGVTTINLGFSGNGRMDKNMADFISGINAKAYIIDCLANCTYETTRDSADYFIAKIAITHPDKHIYMVNNYLYPQQFILPENNSDMKKENQLWFEIYERLRKEGTTINGRKTGPLKNLRFVDVSSSSIIDNEDTVDGTHLTDKGFSNLAKAILRQIDL